MKWWRLSGRYIIWSVIALTGILLVFFPLRKTYNRYNTFVFRGLPSAFRLDVINMKIAYRNEIFTALEGMYQPLARFVNECLYDHSFLPNAKEFAENIVKRPEIQCGVIFNRDGIVQRIGSCEYSEGHFQKTLKKHLAKWNDTTQVDWLYRRIGGWVRIDIIRSETDSSGFLMFFPTPDGKTIGDTAVGLVLDSQWFMDRVPVIMDSVQKHHLNFKMRRDPNNSQYEFAFGAVAADKDTLYWWGRKRVINQDDPYETAGYKEWLITSCPKVKIIVTFGERWLYDRVLKGVKYLQRFLLFNVIGVIIIIIVLILLLIKYIHANQRQRALLSHYNYTLKMPLSRMSLLLEELQELGEKSEDQKDRLSENLRTEYEHIAHASQTSLKKLKQPSHIKRSKDIDLAKELNEEAESWREIVESNKLSYNVNIPTSGWAGKWDTEAVKKALHNLIDNAVKFTILNEGDFIMVKGDKRDNNYIIEVTDSGPGVPHSQRRKIFKPFYTILNEPHSFASGIGLGLNQAQKAVRAHGGTLRVLDIPDGGSTFRVELPF